MSKRVLIIAYQFPPVGGAGVQRVSKFVKYLPDYGWSPTVLTVSNPSVPVFDESLHAEVLGTVDIRKARTLEPGYKTKRAVAASAQGSKSKFKSMIKNGVRAAANLVLQPDPQILWFPNAIREGRKILAEGGFEAIVATGPPFSSFLVARKLSRETGIPYVLDYRDEWDISNALWENKRQGRLSLAIQKRQQRTVLRDASVVIATTNSSLDSLAQRCQQARSSASTEVIFNGFDPDDIQAAISTARANPKRRREATETPKRYRMAYVGTLWNLTSVEPLVDAILSLAKRDPECLSYLELVFAGRRTEPQDAMLDRLESTPVKMDRRPYVDHPQAVELMHASDALFLSLTDVSAARRVIPAKMFEYMAARKRVLGVMPQGDTWELLAEYPGSVLHVPGDVFGIRDSLLTEIDYFREFGTQEFDYVNLRQFSRQVLTGELAEILDSLRVRDDELREIPSLDKSVPMTESATVGHIDD
ncbi:MAG: glycosyltransferase [Planctomycetota bacterium]|nr:glycosyltransferase [Planctomycetota bacterium]